MKLCFEKFPSISCNFDVRSHIYVRSLHFKSRFREKRIFSSRHPVSATSSKYTLPHHPPPRERRECVAVHEGNRREGKGEVGETREEVSLALSVMSSREYVSQDSINLSTSSLFKDGGDFSLPQVSRRVVGKDSNPLSPPFFSLSFSLTHLFTHSLTHSPRVYHALAEHLRRGFVLLRSDSAG